MTDPDIATLRAALDNIKEDVAELKIQSKHNEKKTQEILMSVAILEKTVSNIAGESRERKVVAERVFMFVVGGFIAAGISWIVRGGLSS